MVAGFMISETAGRGRKWPELHANTIGILVHSTAQFRFLALGSTGIRSLMAFGPRKFSPFFLTI